MKNKIFLYGISIGLIVSIIGFILIKTEVISQNMNSVIIKIYRITSFLAVIVIFLKSAFLKTKFNLMFKAITFLFFMIFTLNLLNEYEITQIQNIKLISYILFGGIFVLYIAYKLRLKIKKPIDYLKIITLTLVYIGGFLNLIFDTIWSYNILTTFLFWILIVFVLNEIRKIEYPNLKNVG